LAAGRVSRTSVVHNLGLSDRVLHWRGPQAVQGQVPDTHVLGTGHRRHGIASTSAFEKCAKRKARPEPAPTCQAGGTSPARGRRVRCVRSGSVEVAWRALVPARHSCRSNWSERQERAAPIRKPRGGLRQSPRRLLQQNRHFSAVRYGAARGQLSATEQTNPLRAVKRGTSLWVARSDVRFLS
jgi:hypothetical protein